MAVGHESLSQLNFVRVELGDPMQVYESLSSFDLRVLNLNGIAGAFWQVTPSFGVGARVRAVPLRITGSGDFYISEVVSGTDEDQTAEIEVEDVNVRRPEPWDVGLGASLRASGGAIPACA